MKFISVTDPGVTRLKNEDVFFASKDSIGLLPNLFFVADGMGGEKAGLYAAQTAANTIVTDLMGSKEREPVKAIKAAIEDANLKLFEEAQADPEKESMGTTLVLACIYDDHLIIANVGDSRLYVSKNDRITQITRDHSYVDELVRYGKVSELAAKHHPKRHYITRAVGAENKISIDFFDLELDQSDIFMLCSDGLTNMLLDEEIQAILRSGKSLEEMSKELVDRANAMGGEDNITIVIVDPEIK
ncbi:MAG: Stp1/IreP family PP2C-type Ser/Thr phosphatase [Lachnospiraceae bacterium]|nr:Stp1/IreP family PP2C-type Ser/Thr phosphatase [Lachnospiraceae bacterium]